MVKVNRRLYTFSQLKIQFLEIFDENGALTKAPLELAVHLAVSTKYRWGEKIIVTDSVISEAKGWSKNKVSRAVQQLAGTGVFHIKRGRWNRASEYILEELVWKDATERRLRREKNGGQRDERTPRNGLNISSKVGARVRMH